jgi:hypothetical protein
MPRDDLGMDDPGMTGVAAVNGAFDGISAWLTSVWTSPLAPLHTQGRPSLLPTCFAILACECCGVLEKIPTELRRATADQLLRQQSPISGYFEPGLIEAGDLTSHSATYIRLQATYFAVHAADALGHQPVYKLPLVDKLVSPGYAHGWLDAGPWHNPWLHSNNIMFALSFLQLEGDRSRDPAYLQAYDAILDYLDDRQDSDSGLWQPDGGRDDANAVFAAYHFFPFYFWRGRRPYHVERIIDTILSIQQSSGFFKAGGGGACEDLDAVHTLVMMSLATNHRASDVRAALGRCNGAIAESQQRDGGFRNYNVTGERWLRKLVRSSRMDRVLLGRRLAVPIWRCGGWKPLSCPITESDTWAAWFRPLSLKLIADRYADHVVLNSRGRYRRMPGLGWHDESKIRESQPSTRRA